MSGAPLPCAIAERIASSGSRTAVSTSLTTGTMAGPTTSGATTEPGPAGWEPRARPRRLRRRDHEQADRALEPRAELRHVDGPRVPLAVLLAQLELNLHHDAEHRLPSSNKTTRSARYSAGWKR